MIESLHNADTSITSKPALMNPQAAVLICNYIDTAFIAVFFYDYILNIPAEVELIWSHIRSRGSLWYLIVRYFTFSGFVMISIPDFVDLSHASCHVFNLLRQILMVINAVLISVIFTMRTYALYDRCKRLLACLMFVMLSLFATVCWALGSQHGSIPNSEEILVSLQGCHVPTSRVEAWRMIVAWGCLLAYDTLLFLLTAARAIRRSQLPFRLKRYSSYTHLVATIYRDVAIYYFVMVAFNTATLICFFLESDMFRAVMATPTSVVSAILCARLILNIREATSVIFWTQPAYYTPPICLSTNFDPGLSPH